MTRPAWRRGSIRKRPDSKGAAYFVSRPLTRTRCAGIRHLITPECHLQTLLRAADGIRTSMLPFFDDEQFYRFPAPTFTK